MKSAPIPGLSENSEVRQSRVDTKTSTQPRTWNDELTRAVDKNAASRSSDKNKSAKKQSSADDREKSKDVMFTDASSPFHLWFPASVRIGDTTHESAGHYLATKSLGTESLLCCLTNMLCSVTG